MNNINRRQFLKTSGSLAVGALLAGVSGTYLWRMFTNPGELFHGANSKDAGGASDADTSADFVSPYRRTFGFAVPDDICAFEMYGEQLLLATPNNIYMYNLAGTLVSKFSVSSDVRDIAAHDDHIYVLHPSRIEVYSADGTMVRDWQACSDDADYCAFTVFDKGVFVTDASNKIVCQYTIEGGLVRFIKSPKGFVVPSYSFGITNMDGLVYCSNPGRHVVEVYSAEGEYLRCFGKGGNEPGEFSGCCNPVQLATTNAGELLTSEKGRPRISCYAADGTFRSVLLNADMLGGGHTAYDMRVHDDKLIVVCGKKVQVFQYNSQLAAKTLCGQCTADCPMKVNL